MGSYGATLGSYKASLGLTELVCTAMKLVCSLISLSERLTKLVWMRVGLFILTDTRALILGLACG